MRAWGLWRSTAGNIYIIAAALMPAVIGSAGLAVDTIQWVVWKRQLQRQADSASLAGAYALAQGKDAVATATSDLSRTGSMATIIAPVIQTPPSSGSFSGNSKAVLVSLQYRQKLPFTGMFMSTVPTIGAQAVASAVSTGPYCVLALDPTTTTGITMGGNTTVNLGCGIAANSRGSSAVTAGGSSSITATPISAVGGIPSSSNYVAPTTLLPYSMPQDDPYASLPNPVASSCSNKVRVQPTDVTTLSPGCYRGMDLKGTVTLSPGTYVIDGDDFSVGSQASVSGTGVTIILTSSTAASNPSSIAQADINGGATISLSAPTSGTYQGIIFYQDRRALDSGSNIFNGNSSSFYQGAIYIPSQEVSFTGTTGMSTNCLQMVGKRIDFLGNSAISNVCPSGSGSSSWIGARVKLVA